jgi:hypothetical protein
VFNEKGHGGVPNAFEYYNTRNVNEKIALKTALSSMPIRLVEHRCCVAVQCGKDYE